MNMDLQTRKESKNCLKNYKKFPDDLCIKLQRISFSTVVNFQKTLVELEAMGRNSSEFLR